MSIIKKKELYKFSVYIKLILTSLYVLLGLFFLGAWSIFYLILCILIYSHYKRSINDREERKIILNLILLGFFSRLILGTAAHIFSQLYIHRFDIFGDGDAYVTKGLDIALAHHFNQLPHLFTYQVTGWAYLLGILYKIFGFYPLIGVTVNSLLGVLTALNFYFILMRFFFKDNPSKIIKISALSIFLFFPSLFFWSITNLKDTVTIYFLSILIYAAVKYKQNIILFFSSTLILVSLLTTFRKPASLPLLFFILTVALARVVLKKIPVKKLMVFLLAFIAFMIAFSFIFHFSFKNLISDFFNSCLSSQIAHVSSGGSSYYILPSRFYTSQTYIPLHLTDCILMFFSGWMNMLLVPYSFTIKTFFAFLAYPQMLLWYIFLLFAFMGMAISFKQDKDSFLVLFLYLFFMGTSIALKNANIGTVFRIRDMITPVFLIFSFLGIEELLQLVPKYKKTKPG